MVPLLFIFIATVLFPTIPNSEALPTNYEYYTSDGVSSGLSVDQPQFLLNGKEITIFSGAMHYFRIPRAYWRTGLRKLRAAGLNTVETYAAWNLHEPYSGVFDFGNGGSDMEDFLHVEEFLKTAQEEDLFVIFRGGPYICSEYNFGAFPAWLLSENEIGIRSDDPVYMKYAKRYLDAILSIVSKYQFTKGGPIIAFQVENEYGYIQYNDYRPQKEYMAQLRQIFLDNGIVELLVTSDGPTSSGDRGTIPEYFFQTGNFADSPEANLKKLSELQPNKPLMCMEFWVGRSQYWSEPHHIKQVSAIMDLFETIIKYPASINIYMFYGGTNYGFSNGGQLRNNLLDNSGYIPICTTYDNDAPLTETGDYTEKYYKIKELIAQYNPVATALPDPPELVPRVAYPTIKIEKQIPFNVIIENNAPYVIESENVIAMEKLNINGGSGQTSGYIVYRKENVDLAANTVLKIEGHVCDTVFVLVDGALVSPVLNNVNDLSGFGYWKLGDSTLVLNSEPKNSATVDLVVEEWGRPHSGNIYQYNKTFKGLWQGDVYLNEGKVSGWKIIPLEFKKEWNNNLQGWTDRSSNSAGSLNLAVLEITDDPRDTYIDMRNWVKGSVIVNGFVLGKYADIGVQEALYLPAPLLKKGTNNIIIFEHFRAADEVTFSTDQIWSAEENALY